MGRTDSNGAKRQKGRVEREKSAQPSQKPQPLRWARGPAIRALAAALALQLGLGLALSAPEAFAAPAQDGGAAGSAIGAAARAAKKAQATEAAAKTEQKAQGKDPAERHSGAETNASAASNAASNVAAPARAASAAPAPQAVAGSGFVPAQSQGMAKIEGRPQDAAQAAQWASVKLENVSKQSGASLWSGTGFWLDGSNLALTNNHVATDAALNAKTRELVATDALGRKRAVRVVAVDLARDLAALEIEGEPVWRLPARKGALKVGESVAATGFGLGMPFGLVEGRFSQAVGEGKNARLLISAATDGGVSGGPTVDQDGRVVGVNVAGAGRSAAFSVPIEQAQAFLREAQALQAAKKEAWRQKRAQVEETYRGQLSESNRNWIDAFFNANAAGGERQSGWRAPTRHETTDSIMCSDASDPPATTKETIDVGFECSANATGWSIGGSEGGGAAWKMAGDSLRPVAEAHDGWGASLWVDTAGGSNCRRERFMQGAHPGFVSVCVSAQGESNPIRARVAARKPQEIDGLLELSAAKTVFTETGRESISFKADGLSEGDVRYALNKLFEVPWMEPEKKAQKSSKKSAQESSSSATKSTQPAQTTKSQSEASK